MAALKQDGTCFMDLRSHGLRKRWPCYGRVGQFCLTPIPTSGDATQPDLEADWFGVTHQPTGMKAGDVLVADPKAMEKLAKFAEMFGRAKTYRGVMRKYKALPDKDKRWIKQQVSYRLPSAKKAGK